jgi:uncharacterized protein (TIGR03086 family)
MAPDEQLATIIPMLEEVANNIDATQLDGPTPCSDFTVEGVLGHMTALATGFAPMFRGEEPSDEPAPTADTIAAFVAAMDELLDAVTSPGALDRTITTPGGELPGQVFGRLVALDGLVHGWDLATSTGQDWSPPDDLVAEIDAFAREAVSSEMRSGGAFGPEQTPAGTGAMDRLAAFTGRSA